MALSGAALKGLTIYSADEIDSQNVTEFRCPLLFDRNAWLVVIGDVGQGLCHLIIASFSLQYLRGEERLAFFQLLRAVATRPMLVLIIKGVGTSQRPPERAEGVESTYFGVHYVIGSDRNPRVVEMHLCLITPIRVDSDEPAEERRADQWAAEWVVKTFETLRRRCRRDGLRTGVTMFEEALADPLGAGGGALGGLSL